MNFKYQFFDKNTDLNDSVFDINPAIRVKQVHSSKVIKVNKPLDTWVEADALVTNTPNLPIGVITADCTPVLFCSDGVVGAAHAGWQGALNGVLENTVDLMGGEIANIHAFIGPCISQKSYQVSVGFEAPFIKRDNEAERFFMSGTDNKLQFDLAGYCAFRLNQCGVQKIKIDGADTLTNNKFHSHRGGADVKERNLSAIMIKG